jgi:hypothetical protein
MCGITKPWSAGSSCGQRPALLIYNVVPAIYMFSVRGLTQRSGPGSTDVRLAKAVLIPGRFEMRTHGGGGVLETMRRWAVAHVGVDPLPIYIGLCGELSLTKTNTTTVACWTRRCTYHETRQNSCGDMSATCATAGIDTGLKKCSCKGKDGLRMAAMFFT